MCYKYVSAHVCTVFVDTRSSSEEESINRMVNIEVYIRGGDVLASFPCNELREGGYTSPRLQLVM